MLGFLLRWCNSRGGTSSADPELCIPCAPPGPATAAALYQIKTTTGLGITISGRCLASARVMQRDQGTKKMFQAAFAQLSSALVPPMVLASWATHSPERPSWPVQEDTMIPWFHLLRWVSLPPSTAHDYGSTTPASPPAIPAQQPKHSTGLKHLCLISSLLCHS